MMKFPLLRQLHKRISRVQRCIHHCKKEITLMGVLEDRNSSYLRGCAAAPSVIRSFVGSPSSNDECELGINVLESICGDIDVTPSGPGIDDMFHDINNCVKQIVSKKNRFIALGGDHSVTYPLCKSLRSFCDKPFIIVHFDAHPDIYPIFEGQLNSHACPFARIVEEPNLCKKLISIGVRGCNRVQRDMIEKHNVDVVEAKDFHMTSIRDYLTSRIAGDDLVYVSVDIDVLDPGFAPGVSHREAGGLTPRELINAIHSIPGHIVGADVVEYNPNRDMDFLTASVAAKCVKELIGKMIGPSSNTEQI